MKTKVCIKCNQEQPFDYFVNDKNRQDGKFPYCKTCTSTNPDRFIEKYADKLEGVKKCPDCGKKYPYSEFYNNKNDSRGMSSQCKKCMMKRRKVWEVENPDMHFDKRRGYGLRKNYGITINDYNDMFEKQNGLCAVCGSDSNGTTRSKHLFVDHDHTTGKIRGLLCNKCNQALGLLNDNTSVLERAINYLLKRHD